MEELIKTLRVGHVFCLLHTGNQSDEKTRHNSRLFAQEVMPKLRNMWPEWKDDERWWIHPLEDRVRPELRAQGATTARARLPPRTLPVSATLLSKQKQNQVKVSEGGSPCLYLRAVEARSGRPQALKPAHGPAIAPPRGRRLTLS